MKKIFYTLITIGLTLNLSAQTTVRKDAARINNYGVTYSLPKTAIKVEVEYAKITQKTGDFFRFSEKYLNIKPIDQNAEYYELIGINAETIGEPDRENTYIVEFKPNSASSFLTLTENGLICAINDNYSFPVNNVQNKAQTLKRTSTLNGSQYLTEETLTAGSTAKQAELIAKQIYRLRESRNNILTGEADNMPPDGDAYKLVMQQLDDQEQALTQMFVGVEEKTFHKEEYIIDVTNQNIKDFIVARFSKKLGLLRYTNLAGEPIYLSLTAVNPLPQDNLLNERQLAELEKKLSKGIVYNIPGKAILKVEFNNKIYVDKACDVVQFGSKDVLDNKSFGDKNAPMKVIFYPSLGAIKETGIANLK